MSSNSMLELPLHFFSAGFLLCAGYTLLRHEYVRIVLILGRFSARTQTWLDVLGPVFLLIPMVLLFIYMSWPVFIRAYPPGEISTNAGGLLIWPARALVPAGFVLLPLQ